MKSSLSMHFRPFRRLRWPVFFALMSLACLLAVEFAPIPASAAGYLRLAGQVAFILAIGWAVTTVIDHLIARRLGKLQIKEKNNLAARKTATRLDVLRRIWVVVGGVATLAAALTVIPFARQLGVSILASAGIAGIAVGIAAQPVLSNLIAGLQIAFTQPIRIDDAVVVENEWGWIEEIGLFYVVIRIWDWRRLVVPLAYFTKEPFQNWTRNDASIIGSVFWKVDYRTPVEEMREKLTEICKSTDLWDGNVVNLQVVETDNSTMQIRALASSGSSPEAWDLRCLIREKMIAWLQAEHPQALPRFRTETEWAPLPNGYGPNGHGQPPARPGEPPPGSAPGSVGGSLGG